MCSGNKDQAGNSEGATHTSNQYEYGLLQPVEYTLGEAAMVELQDRGHQQSAESV